MTRAKQSKNPSYEQLRTELDDTVAKLQSENLDIDEALVFYARGLELVQQLEAYLKSSENKVRELRKKLDSQS